MPDASLPEIQRSSLAGAVLHLKALKLPLDVLAFDFLDPPARCGRAGRGACCWGAPGGVGAVRAAPLRVCCARPMHQPNCARKCAHTCTHAPHAHCVRTRRAPRAPNRAPAPPQPAQGRP